MSDEPTVWERRSYSGSHADGTGLVDMTAELATVLDELRALSRRRLSAERRRAEAMEATRPLVRRAHALGIGPTELMKRTGLTRRTIYDVLDAEA